MPERIKIAINGFGRIGRSVLRAYYKYYSKYKEQLEIIAINDIADIKTLAHLLKYDSVMRGFEGKVEIGDGIISINGNKINMLKNNLDSLPWKKLGVDIVIESTGIFLSKKDAEIHIKNGAKKVIFSAPAKEDIDATIVIGVNDKILTPQHNMVSNSSCTTNCLAPLIKILQDNFGVESAFMVTVHSYTNDQNILDAPHRDLRRARAAALCIIPTTTGATKAVEKVIPELKGKLAGYSLRIPTPNVSITDVTATLKKDVTAEEINQAMRKASEGELKGILQYMTDELVSIDMLGNPHSSIFDSLLTQVIGSKGKNIRVVSWYDNEWGYSNRLLDLSIIMGNFK